MRTIYAICVLLATAALAGGQDAPATLEDVVKDILMTIDQISATLKTVEDEKTAEAARPELQKTAKRFLDVRKKAETMKPPAREEKDRLEKEYKQKLTEAQKKLFGEIGRVRTVPGGTSVLKELQAVVAPKK